MTFLTTVMTDNVSIDSITVSGGSQLLYIYDSAVLSVSNISVVAMVVPNGLYAVHVYGDIYL